MLQAAHQKYDHREDVAGYTLSRQKLIATSGSAGLSVPKEYNTYMYQILGTWGFSPRPKAWIEMRKFHHETVAENKSFEPLVPNIHPSYWYKQFKKKNRLDSFWSIWHIYWSWKKGQYTIFPNLPNKEGFVISRKAAGLHHGEKDKSKDPLCLHWNESYVDFPHSPMKIGYDGKVQHM